jgi:hypothetical protein
MPSKWRSRLSHHEWLLLFLAVAPVLVIVALISYLIGLVL